MRFNHFGLKYLNFGKNLDTCKVILYFFSDIHEEMVVLNNIG